MIKKPFANDVYRKPNRSDVPLNPQKKELEGLVELAAERLAILIWKTWLHRKNTEAGKNKMKNYPKRPSVWIQGAFDLECTNQRSILKAGRRNIKKDFLYEKQVKKGATK